MKTKVTVIVDVDPKSRKHCGKCSFRGPNSTLCALLGENNPQWLKSDTRGALRSAYCRRTEIKEGR
jgi:hypothetical protein